ncbi:MAG: type II toxin-antitoxin system PemK/MazF family toxin [Candidatus Diapherotrites archaeon]
MSSSSFEQGEIVIAPIPFSNLIEAKIRPALIISNREYNKSSEDIIVLKITSKVKDYPFDIELNEKDISEGTLKEESVIQTDFPVVIEKRSIAKPVGKITKQKLNEVKEKIKELYSI